MRSFSSLGIWLSLVFGCLLLALAAEVYYLLWWKKKVINGGDIKDDYRTSSSSIGGLFYVLCWKKPSSLSSTTLNPQEVNQYQDQETNSVSSKDVLVKPFGGDEDVEAELKKLHNRFLFTINEETKEDLESEDGRSRDGRSRKGSRGRSLSDFLFKVDTPFMSPLPSPPIYTPPLTPKDKYNNNHHGFNPLFESSTDAEVNRIRSSPPPKFKFLIDAEEKLYKRKLIEEALKNMQKTHGVDEVGEDDKMKHEQDGSLITIIVDPQHHSNASQVLPLASSPSTIKATNVPLGPQRFR